MTQREKKKRKVQANTIRWGQNNINHKFFRQKETQTVQTGEIVESNLDSSMKYRSKSKPVQFQSLCALITQHSAALHHLGKGKVTQELKDVSIAFLIQGEVIVSILQPPQTLLANNIRAQTTFSSPNADFFANYFQMNNVGSILAAILLAAVLTNGEDEEKKLKQVKSTSHPWFLIQPRKASTASTNSVDILLLDHCIPVIQKSA